LRLLLTFWAVLLLLLAATAGVLQYLGPPKALVAATLPLAAPAVPAATGPAAPDPALHEARAEDPTSFLPRVAPDGRRAMTIYAAPAHIPPGAKTVAILVAGMGLSQSTSMTAINQLPAAVSFAFSPYSADPAPLLDAARAKGHEYLLSLPLEPAGAPLSDEGAHALQTGSEPGANFINLEWALSRIDGYVGVTSALDGMKGEAYLRSGDLYASLQDQISQRGLLFIDARPGAAAPARAVGRSADLVIDDPDDPASIDAKLAALLALAQRTGSALGVAGPLRPQTLAHLAAWIAALPTHGVTLVPVSAEVAQAAP
jgi:polysaccharide deacetylase 2 family uncharacterized protein YibQ